MRKLHILLMVFAAVILMVPASSQSATVTKSIQSQADIDVYGPVASPAPAPGSSDWTPEAKATALDPSAVDPTWPDPLTTDSLKDAVWITTPSTLDPAKPNNMFSDSTTVTLPCLADNLKGTVYTTANNSQDVYVNDTKAGSTSVVTNVSALEFTPVAGENTFNFDFVVQTGAGTGQSGPVGLIYKAVISYDVPDVLWRPPISGSHRTLLKYGTTLPVKFVLKKDGKPIRTVQNIYVAVTGTPTEGEIARFDIGQGSKGLKFARGNGQYMTNFKTKNYPLVAGQQYTISVNDICTGEVLNSVQIQIQGKKPHGRH